jgi:phosphonate transport system substrate-binding protein
MQDSLWIIWRFFAAVIVIGVLMLVVWLGGMPEAHFNEPDQAAATPATNAFRLGLIPERDILEQRQRYQSLASYLSQQLNQPVELVTLNTYSSVLNEFEAGHIDAAFVGSMVAVLAQDRLGTRVLVKPLMAHDVSTYRGVVFVRQDSPIQNIDDLAGKSIAMVRTTTAGNLFPIYLFVEHGMLNSSNPPQLHWAGTHDEVVREVMEKNVDAGAAKDLRIEAMAAADRTLQLRWIAVSEPVPNNALIVRHDMSPELAERLKEILLNMNETLEGQAILQVFGAMRFLPCSIDEYKAIYDMADELGPAWSEVGVEGSPPKRPASLRAASPQSG